jgi:ribonucleoside-triphosphate reductase (thioredoxin)
LLQTIKEILYMQLDKKILSDITVYTKYAKYKPELQRRETWEELVDRNMKMHIDKYPHLKDDIESIYKNYVYTKKVLPSMRSLQFGGRAIELNNARIYNCAFLPIDDIRSFSETMFLLLGGTGVGYSVQNHHIDKLPEIRKPNYDRNKRYVVQDSIIGWADAIKTLFKSYTGSISSHIDFDLSDIRPKGALLVTAGGKAPGPEPLRIALVKIEAILREKENSSKLTDIECHDIQCHIADAVLAGGIRRAAMISLFDLDSDAMLNCKAGNWWENNPQRGRANNSVTLLRHKIDKKTFDKVWERIEASGSGEPGIYLTNDRDWGTNPCCEIALRPYQFCNLVEINAANIESQQDLNERSRAASFIATLQASYTDFHYLRDIWRKNTEKDALLGVSMTGIASDSNLELNFEEASTIVKEQNKLLAEGLGINIAARTTAVKPAGTTSLVVGSSSGIHAWHAPYYLRRMRVGKNEAIYTFLQIYHPELIEDEYFSPNTTAVITVPQKAPEGAITRTESTLDLLERVKLISRDWVKSGHIKGQNTHNVSCTVSVRPNEWKIVGEWMWVNKEYYNGLSVLPYDGGTYKQTPFEDCTKETYDKLMEALKDVDLTKVVELQDDTVLGDNIACGGAGCEI